MRSEKEMYNLILGIARSVNAKALSDNGADEVVTDLENVTADILEHWFNKHRRKKRDRNRISES